MKKETEIMDCICRCFDPPKDTPFLKEAVYEWSAIIDGKCVYGENGYIWYAGEIEFYQHFQILKGKR